MKKLFLIFILLLFITNGFNQTYHPIPTDSVWWVESGQGPYMGGYCIQTITSYIYPAGSITILGQSYAEFHSRELITYDYFGPPPSSCPPSDDLYPDHLYALIRNDSINKKVYLYDSNTTHADILLYDFDISLGDTVILLNGYNNNCSYDTFTVANIDSIDIGGQYRRQYEIYSPSSMWMPIYLIEGVGSNYGFAFNEYCPFEYSSGLVCYHYKQLEYGDVGSSYCTTTLNIQNDFLDEISVIKPIGYNQFEIINADNQEVKIQCYDLLGKFILEKSFHESGYLDFVAIPSGIYFMDIVYNGQPIKPYKFIVQH